MASLSSVLPRIFHWVFLVLEGIFALAAVAVLVVLAVNPHLPPGAHFGPVSLDVLGQPGSITLRATGAEANVFVSLLRGNITFLVANAGGLIEILKQYGLTALLLKMIFCAALFDLLRRLFRNVGRGESFSRSTVRLVQWVAGLLIGFSFAAAFAQGLFEHAVIAYLTGHAVITVSGTPIHFPAPHYAAFPHGGGFPLGHPIFFTGLLVLALSEVFRQGLALKNENELTI